MSHQQRSDPHRLRAAPPRPRTRRRLRRCGAGSRRSGGAGGTGPGRTRSVRSATPGRAALGRSAAARPTAPRPPAGPGSSPASPGRRRSAGPSTGCRRSPARKGRVRAAPRVEPATWPAARRLPARPPRGPSSCSRQASSHSPLCSGVARRLRFSSAGLLRIRPPCSACPRRVVRPSPTAAPTRTGGGQGLCTPVEVDGPGQGVGTGRVVSRRRRTRSGVMLRLVGAGPTGERSCGFAPGRPGGVARRASGPSGPGPIVELLDAATMPGSTTPSTPSIVLA